MRITNYLALLLILVGCETTVKKDVFTPQTTVTVNGNRHDQTANGSGGGSGNLDQALGTDESVVRLDKIINAMMLYYTVKRDLPQSLRDLVPLTDGDLQLNAPSGQPYVYTRAGLRSPGLTKRIIVNDPAPTPTGRRYCIVLDDTPPGASLLLEVQPVPENLFLGYQ